MIKSNQKLASAVAAIAFSLASFSASAVNIDNGFATNQQAYWRVDVTTGGESRAAWMTGTGTPSGTVHANTEIVFDYFSYIDVGSGGFSLAATAISSAAALSGPGEVTSAGSFTGAGAAAPNTIDWVMVSTIAPGGSIMTNELTLTARTGTLGAVDFYQYLDEDVLGSGNDFFFTRGSAAGLDLELFTIDNAEAIGVSHSGALSGGQGLVNTSFYGWAADVFNNMKPRIAAGTQSATLGGVIEASLAAAAGNHPVVGPGNGPRDIVSVGVWRVDPAATTATIVTTLGGVPDIGDIVDNPDPNVPIPALNIKMLALLTLLLGVAGIVAIRRRRTS